MPVLVHPKGARPLAFEALLLFAPPFEFTLQKLLALLEFGERSHQLFADRANNRDAAGISKLFRPDIRFIDFLIGVENAADQLVRLLGQVTDFELLIRDFLLPL